MTASGQSEYSVYVIEFDAPWVSDKGSGTVYVGYTARTPEQRLQTHREGGRTAAAVFKRSRKHRGTNLRLRPDLATAKPSHAGPWPTEKEAMKHERKLANRLRAHGYVVEVGLGKPKFWAARSSSARALPREPGHLFVVHGDLTKLHCDGLLIPCDSFLNVSAWWAPFLPAHEKSTSNGWIRPIDVSLQDGLAFIGGTDSLPPRVLVDTVGAASGGVEGIVAVTLRGLDQVAEIEPGGARALPLVAMPMVGTGEGTHGDRKGEVAASLIPKLTRWVRANHIDVAIVLQERSAYHAVQSLREPHDHADDAWAPLGTRKAPADELGRLAAEGGLSLFAGAGVSRSLGLPDWEALLSDLCGLAKVEPPPSPEVYLDVAQRIRTKLGNKRFEKEMVKRFALQRYGLGHALLASLGVRQSITTNYDNALELAMTATGRDVRVLTRQEAERDHSWVLKIHGDIEKPETLVLSTEDYARLEVERKALYGVLHALLLTSHLLFVGFGFGDGDFQRALDEVKDVRKDVDAPARRRTLATTVTLADAAAQAFPDEIDKISMVDSIPDETSSGHAARLLEIFLDRVAFKAATEGSFAADFLLDPAYASGLTDADRRLAEQLRKVASGRPDDFEEHSGWRRLGLFLRSLGMPERP